MRFKSLVRFALVRPAARLFLGGLLACAATGALAQGLPQVVATHTDSLQAAGIAQNATLEKAEINYRARRLSAAMEQFGMVAAMQDHPFAWLRVGNICHRRGDVTGAFDAYKRAQIAASQSERFADLRDRAVMNLALLGLDQAQVALEQINASGAGKASATWVTEVRTRIGELSDAMPGVDPYADGRQTSMATGQTSDRTSSVR